jgi:hypothetical protein
MQFKRPRLTKREDAAAPAPAAPQSPAPQPAKAAGKGISTRELQAALGGSFTPTGGGGGAGVGKGITSKELGKALALGSGSSTGSVESTRVTSYPGDQDLNALPVKAGTRTGPRVTSYRIPLRKSAHSNVYDTIT